MESAPAQPIPSSALEFDEFSFWSDEEGFRYISQAHELKLSNYLHQNYGVLEMLSAGPYLVLYCEPIPDEDTRPFTIAGCVGVWLGEHDGIPAEIGIGDVAGGDDLEIDEVLSSDLREYEIPKLETLIGLTKYFSRAYAVTYLNTGLIIKMPAEDASRYQDLLETYPGSIKACGVTLDYHNGPLGPIEMKKSKVKPNPKKIDAVADETDYVHDQAFFSSGDKVKYNEDFTIDGFGRGIQRLKCLGRRVRVVSGSREKDCSLPTLGQYAAFNQGIYATSSQNPDLGLKTMGGGQLHCYIDDLDDLTKDGWKVVPLGSKGKAQDEEKGN